MTKVGYYDERGHLHIEDGYLPADTNPPVTEGLKEVILRESPNYQTKTIAYYKGGKFMKDEKELTNVNWWKN